MGLVINIYPDKFIVVCIVDIKLGNSIKCRSINLLIPLMSDNHLENISDKTLY